MFEGQNPNMKEGAKGSFIIQRIYHTNVIFEVPGAPMIFKVQANGEPEFKINAHSEQIEEDIYEISLSLKLTVRYNGDIGYFAKLRQCGVFTVKGFDEAKKIFLLGSYCPNLLYPYAREEISNLVTKASFPPFIIAPVNFDALVSDAMKQRKAAQAAGGGGAAAAGAGGGNKSAVGSSGGGFSGGASPGGGFSSSKKPGGGGFNKKPF